MKNIVNNIKNIGYLKDNMFAFEYDREAFREQVEKEAREEAIKEAKEQGIEQGIEQGEKNKTIEIAKNLIKNGMSAEDISKNTKLSHEEIIKLKEEIKR